MGTPRISTRTQLQESVETIAHLREQLDKVESERDEARRAAESGWESARVIAIACNAHATERAADKALAAIRGEGGGRE